MFCLLFFELVETSWSHNLSDPVAYQAIILCLKKQISISYILVCKGNTTNKVYYCSKVGAHTRKCAYRPLSNGHFGTIINSRGVSSNRGCLFYLRGSNCIILIGGIKFGDLVLSIVERYLIQCPFLGDPL